MGTVQTPNPTLYPNRSPIPNPHPNPNSVSDANSPSYDDVSKFFSLPLSDAADSLGVCPSVLKKLCYDNGLVRWPYRQFLSGKSMEEIKKDAAIENSKQLAELPKVAGLKNDALSSSPISSSIVSQLQNKSAGAQQEMPKFRIENSHNMHSSNVMNGSLDSLDEFKYGFPSNGLPTVTYRWWGNTNSNCNSGNSRKHDKIDANRSNPQSKEDLAQKYDNEDANESNQQSKDMPDDAADLSPKDGEMSESKTSETDMDTQWTHLHFSLKKKAVEEGKQALKLGVYRGYGVNKLDQSKKMVLLQIFKSALPSQWKDLSL
ncbi:RWP-RK domain-containing protein [Abeliophyllum distichum]|uniref:RWP-RK domain-containing protein n=1 Tax=Abeliophyllum distichum TaxID=126358 RepID=A0ABD1PRX8_9LAMI